MKHRLVFSSLPLLVLILALAPTALASSTWYVDGVHGSDNNNCKSRQTACKTIGHAISLAHSGDSIMVAAATYTENLTIGFSLKVIGSGAETTIIDGGGVNRVVTIPNANAHVALSNVTIRNGSAGDGGGIYNSGTLMVTNSTVAGNVAIVQCFTLCTAKGGGIYNSGTLMVIDSTFSGNRVSMQCSHDCAAVGGGIYNSGTLRISNSTINGNSAARDQCGSFCFFTGGGVYSGSTLTINNSTLSGNSATTAGGGIFSGGTATLQNSIVANSSGENCYGTMTSKGYNLSSDNTCDFDNSGDLNNTDPKLGQLGNYGGPTQTMPLLSGSPAIDAGNPNGCTDGNGHLLKTDQRGEPRPDKEDKSGCDMGAYERQAD
jgi:predicted outer membrane repeat protein